MTDFLIPTAALAGALLLARAGLGHLRGRRSLRRALDRQDVVPRPVRGVVAATLGPIELMLALTTALALVGGGRVPVVAAGSALVAIGLGFTGLVVSVLVTRPGAPCGCMEEDEATTTASLARPLLVTAAGAALLGGAADRLAGLGPAETAVVLCAGVAFAAAADGLARSLAPALAPHPEVVAR